MKQAFKIFLWIVGGLIAGAIGLFLLGFFGAMFGLYDTKSVDRASVSIAEPLDTRPIPAHEALPTPARDPLRSSSAITVLKLPNDLDAKSALTWMSENRLIGVKDGAVNVKFDNFRGLSGDDALTLHTLFEKARHAADIQHSTPDTEADRRRYYMARLLVFAGASALVPDQRRNFAKRAGAVFPSSAFHDGRHRGDFVNLFNWHKTDPTGSAEIAIKNFAGILTDKEMIAALTKLGVITVSATRANSNMSSRWRIETGDMLSQLEPETLQVIHDAVKTTIAGDRRKLKAHIRTLIESRHTDGDNNAP